jgi:CBS domain-containing protein
MPRKLGNLTIREVPVLREDERIGAAIEKILEEEVPALPVADDEGRLQGIFGEREFIGAIFPRYLGELKYAGFVSDRVDAAIEKHRGCLSEPVSKYMNTDHIDVGVDYSDAQVAEVFLHHRVLIVPVTEDRHVRGIITRWDFFKELATHTEHAQDAAENP